tara:strand:+ start:65 stop:1051 length:987 start_codon:yes stop_codon:yes gene_type:complete
MFNNKSILITGATGSFGTKFLKIFTKQYKPKRLIVFSRDEYKQYLLNRIFNEPYMRYFIGDVRDYERLNHAFRGVDYVVHAAAMKQVPASEYNPTECIKTNIDGAKNVVNAAINQNVKKVIALSTDKAVNPINLYGATKLASDKLFVSANNIAGKKNTIFSVTRYGNVINSRGSVIELFKKIKKEKKIYPITHMDMTRFFIKQEDAVDFVLNNFIRMRGGEIFVPKMPSLKIEDLINTIDKNPKIREIGIRPGEKLHEVLCNNEEARNTIEFKNYFLIKPDEIPSTTKKINYLKSKNGEKGKKVKNNFLYTSNLNPDFLSNKEIKKLL